MQTWKLTLPTPHIGQRIVKKEAKRFNVVDCGRRFGKTTLGLDRCADPAILAYPVGWFSPTYKMLSEVWRDAVRLFAPITIRRSVQERRIEFITGGLLEFWSLDNSDAARGRKYKRIIVDEAGMIKNLMDAWNFVLRPTLVDYTGDAFFLSTPKGLNGFWQMWQWGQDASQPEWMSWKMPTLTNPLIPASEVEAMRLSMPERVFEQEILGNFIDSSGGVFRKVREAATAQPHRDHLGNMFIMGADFGKHNDFTVLTMMDADLKQMVEIDRFNQIDYSVQVGRLRAMYDRWKPIAIIAERNSIGDPIIERLQLDGLPVQPFTTTNASKAQIIDGLALAFERSEISILDNPILLGELMAYEMERLPSGMLRYSAPESQHDDCVVSLALAWYGCSSYQTSPVLASAFAWN
jgi:hypothetical protein